ncbi:MAG: sigma 54-interacting transcriptional regulator [bacterium]
MMTSKKQTILIIEDEALIARELKSRLTQMGYEVVGIAFGLEAIELAADTQPDLLLTDIHLKDGVDGIEVAQVIQAERGVPVVFLTAYSDEETVSRAKEVTPYGYIIKPVENRELQIVIEMALYKFSIERELRKTQQLLQTALTCIGNGLVFVNQWGDISDLNSDAETILETNLEVARDRPWPEVFSLLGNSVQAKINAALLSSDVTKLAPFVISAVGKIPKLVDGIVGPMHDGGVLILRELTEIADPIEMLPTTQELMLQVGPDRLTPSESSMCQLLVSFKTKGKPVVVEEVSQVLNQMLRSTDLVSIYSPAHLSVSMPYTSVVEGELIADSVLSSLKKHFSLTNPSISIGLSYSSPGDQQPFELFRRAEWALSVAKDSGGDRVIVWSDDVENSLQIASTESEKQREYHNLVLMWNVVSVVARTTSLEEMSKKICHHLLRSFDFDQVAVLESENSTIWAISGAVKGVDDFKGMQDIALSKMHFLKVGELLASNSNYVNAGKVHLFRLSAEKLVFITGGELLQSDVEFLETLVNYVASGLSRFDLPAEATTSATGESHFLYQSAIMKSLVESIEMVGPTEATVLISGESGTGKELIAKTIHENSKRKDKPYIIVDCGAIVGSLIESELFGHIQGSFTGADKNFSGRLKEADGGTVLLDEVGELPLDVQVKLLRYVQERQLVPVGSNRYELVDTRVIAATNRDLQALVREGKFREDLYYRLNVFAIDSPPLRARQGDIMLLANHYLKIYSSQYSKNLLGFTENAEKALVEHSWPGNIRELINVINRGLILCKDSRLSSIHLGLFPAESNEIPTRRAKDQSPESHLQTLLKRMVDSCMANVNDLPPLGRWLEEDLIKKSLALNSEVLNRAALTLRVPESTLRRKVSRLQGSPGIRNPGGQADWEILQTILLDLTVLARDRGQTVLDLVSFALVRELEQRSLNRKEASSLMGVSLPTYRRLVAEVPLEHAV